MPSIASPSKSTIIPIPFVKMQGIGNDFVVIDNLQKNIFIDSDITRKMADRRFGIGADQILVVEPSQKSDFRMLIYNADGSQVEMCGNGIRCVAQFLRCRKNISSKKLKIDTLAGEREIFFRGDLVEVDMGQPIFSPEKIPVKLEKVVMSEITVGDKDFVVTALSMGNPHCVLIVDDCRSFPLEAYGPLFEKHALFPHRTNFECVQIIDESTIKTRVWERGVGVTLACGTGACASFAAACLTGKIKREGSVILDGGRLHIRWADNNHIAMLGPAEEVFEGTFFMSG